MRGKTNILHLRASNFVGGPEKQIIEHLRRLNNVPYQGLLASFLEGGESNKLIQLAKSQGLACFGIPMSGLTDYKALGRIIELIRQEEVKLLCLHGYKAILMGWWAGKRTGTPTLAFSRGDTAENLKVTCYEWLERKSLPWMDGVIAVSYGQKTKLEAFGIDSQKIRVVHNAVEVNPDQTGPNSPEKAEVFRSLDIPKDVTLIVSAGRLSPEKGHRDLIEAIPQINQREKTFFVFCGEGPCKKKLIRQAQKLGVLSHCRFPGFRRDLEEIFKAMDLFVLPSLTEGFPNVILEAFACAKPVVATAVGGVPEIVDDGLNGFLVPPKRIDLLSQAISKCLSSKDLGRSLGEAGYQKVGEKFTFESQTKKLEQIYGEILGL